MIRVADYIMNSLHNAGVTHVFQVTGRGSLFLSDALAKHPGLHPISLHHEQSCAFAAIGNAEKTGGLGAVLVSTGCASTNTLTGVLSAWQDGIPCVIISGQNTLSETTHFTGLRLRTYGQQEADIVQMVGSITKYAHMLTRPGDIPKVMDLAINAATTGRKGPVWIDVPLDLQSALIDPSNYEKYSNPKESVVPEINEEELVKLMGSLSSAKRPIALIGKGIRSAGAELNFLQFIERWNLPVAYSSSAPDVYGSSNDLSIGSVGAMGCSRAGNFAIANADLVLVLGSRLNSLTTGPDFCNFARSAKVIVVDIDAVEHSKKSIRIDHFIHADLKKFFERLNSFSVKPICSNWVEQCFHWKKIFRAVELEFQASDSVDLYQLADCLSGVLPNPSTIVTDSGFAEVILPSNIRFDHGHHCVHPSSQGAMGFALPAAIGVQCAGTNPVVVVVGDGSVMMNLQELESIRYLKLPIKIVVINNNAYGIIRKRQKDLFRTRTVGTDPGNGLSCPEFKKVAECFDLSYLRISSLNELEVGLKEMFATEGPVLCEIMGREDQSYIEIGYARSSIDRKIVRRPLEDQSPFIKRELFLREMIVPPINQ